ncbi:MAG TPA: histidinol dehydrogenase, partial [Plasticicumulans sp.]
MDIARLNYSDPDFWPRLDRLTAWEGVSDAHVAGTVAQIIADLRARGDAALLELTNRYDRTAFAAAAELEIPAERLDAALCALPPAQRTALETAAARVRAYAERQKLDSWSYTEADGTLLGQQVTALDAVGLYVPGGKAAYPSSVLMNAIPAKVAGVRQLVMVVPTPDGEQNDLVLAAARLA